jgi:signal transduction histidine kinase
MLREIAWIQSHKVRSPVANILGLVNLVDDCEKEELIYILENIKEATKNLDNIIREVVDKTNFIESNPIKVFQ